jgi:CxxC-x17-CxxC domain-containing protein
MFTYMLCLILFSVGLYCVLRKRNLIKIIIGIGIMEYAANLFFILIGYRKEGRAPIYAHDQAIKNMVELIDKMQEQIAIIDRKIDTLISKSSVRPVETRPVEVRPAPKQENGFRERVLHKAVCADCKKSCEVPFKPSGERPVYCKDCFSKRKARGPFGARPDNRPRTAAPVQAAHIAKPEAVQEKKKPAVKKKPGLKKKKK